MTGQRESSRGKIKSNQKTNQISIGGVQVLSTSQMHQSHSQIQSNEKPSHSNHTRSGGSMVLKGRLTNSYVHMPKQDTTNDKSGSMGSTGQLSQHSNKGKQILLKNASSSQIHNQVRPNYGNPHANVRKANGQSAKRKASKAGQHALNMFSKSNVAGQASNGSIITIGSMDSLAIQGN